MTWRPTGAAGRSLIVRAPKMRGPRQKKVRLEWFDEGLESFQPRLSTFQEFLEDIQSRLGCSPEFLA